MFDIVSTVTNVCRRWYLCRSVMSMLIYRAWGVILLTGTCLMVDLLFLYNCFGAPIIYPIDLQTFINPVLIQHTCIHCSCLSVGTAPQIIIIFLWHQLIMVPLKSLSVDVTGRISVISFAWSVSQFVLIKFDYFCAWLISAFPDLNKHWRGLLLDLNILLLEYMIGSCGWCMIYSMTWGMSRNSGSVL